MVAVLVTAGIIFISQAFVTNPWQLMALRFLLGLAAGGFSAVNILLKRLTPDALTGRVFGGSVLGGQVAARLGIRYMFFVTAVLLLANAAWVFFNMYRKLESRRT